MPRTTTAAQKTTTTADVPWAFTILEAAHKLRLGRNSTYDLVREGRLRAVKVGSRVIIPAESLRAFLAGHNEEAA